MQAPNNIIIIGASTGGVKVVQRIFECMPPLNAALLVVQHMPAYINTAFVGTLGTKTRMPVKLAETNDVLIPGRVLVAPGDQHLELEGNARVVLRNGPKVNFVRPSIDVTMHCLQPFGPGCMITGVLLTGMGNDGAAGISHIKRLGGLTVAQEESTCPVFGMPKEAIRTGDVDQVLSPERIAELLAKLSEAPVQAAFNLRKAGGF
jgi:two-component system chemotaxis response regulator CheB